MKRILAASSILILVGCNQPVTPNSQPVSSPSNSPISQSSPLSSPSVSPVSNNKTISETGIGDAKLGMTFGQLKQKLGTKAEFKVQSPYIVDFDAIAVTESGKTQYYILYPAGTTFADSSKIEALLTDNPEYRTAAEISPGITLKQAETAYGKATLAYNTDNEGREYVTFAQQPSKAIGFRMGALGDDSLAGIYPSSTGSENETKEYKDTATIQAIEVR